jgi:hypothetical protein
LASWNLHLELLLRRTIFANQGCAPTRGCHGADNKFAALWPGSNYLIQIRINTNPSGTRRRNHDS